MLDESIAGFAAGAAATLVLHPMDLLKTRLQLSRSSLSSIFSTLNQSGMQAYYRGVSPNLAGISPINDRINSILGNLLWTIC
jgi:solute carrier family 25 folate transporter 32